MIAKTAKASGFRAFVEEHDQLFTMIGALIVFLSFYLKEVRLEKINALESQLTAAKSNTQISDQTENISSQIDALNGQISDLQTNGQNNSVFHDEYVVIEQSSESFGAAQDQLGVAKDLMNGLPLGTQGLKATAQQLTDNIGTLTPLQDQARSMRDEINLGAMKSGDEVKKKKAYERLMPIASQFVSGAATFRNKVKAFRAAVDKEVERQLNQLGRESGGATRVTYSLFGLGWVMGLVGKVLKIPALSGGTD